ncbi:hypothetical protein EJ06DRAFT_560885 [Trichodelitschia bisporula]|uniref:Acyltransferase 3 domain-containing protein n=1 Tax=Trichodelitschia bisporula TaxID=703511 RepID=A0A6G1IBG6_9PEZI|nr:hypothetical protein EJ06DRAFT_560885 [Trichodelitschia bisporula]
MKDNYDGRFARLAPDDIITLLDKKERGLELDSDSEASSASTPNLLSRLPPPTPTLHLHLPRIHVPPLQTLFLRTLHFLLPSFLRHTHGPTASLHPTAYLDGLRGLAALFVFFCHHAYTSFVITRGYGVDGHGSPLLLPIVRLLYSGPPMVCVFFVVSGYALSLKPLRLARARNWDAFAGCLSSAVFRRAMRLFFPTTVSTGMIALLLQLGAYEPTRAFAQDRRYVRNVVEHHPVRLGSLGAQLRDWARTLFNFVHVWTWAPFGGSTPYDVHLWTIPVEFRCSAVLFLTLLGLGRVRAGIRLFLLSLIMAFTLRSDRWEMTLFFAGMMLAELDLMRGAHRPPPSPLNLEPLNLESQPRISAFRTGLWRLVALAALYLMSQPDEAAERTYGWRTLVRLIPGWFSEKYRFYQCLGSVFFVLAVGRERGLRRVFEARCVQYFGRISYALYLVHGPVIHVLGYKVMGGAWGWTGVEGGYVGGWVGGTVVVVPLTVWVADVWWRGVDAPVVRLARWVEGKCEGG